MSWKILALLIGLVLAYGVLLPVMLGVLKAGKSADEQSEQFCCCRLLGSAAGRAN